MAKGIYDLYLEYADLKEMMNDVAVRFREEPVFKYEKKGIKTEITYERFKNDIDGFGTYLFSEGFNGDKKIAVLGENSYEWIVTYFSVVNGGNVIIPLDKELKPNELLVLLNSSETDVLVYSKHKQKAVDEMVEAGLQVPNLICMDEMDKLCQDGQEIIAGGNTEYLDVKIDVEKMCAIIYTSGTTGTPKGVMLNQKNLTRDAYLSISCSKIPRDTVAVLPLNHTFGFMACILCQVWMGYCTFITSSLKTFMRDVKEHKPAHISVVPLFVESIYKNIWKTAEKSGKAGLLKKLINVSNGMRKVGIDMRRTLFKTVLDGFGGNLEMIISGGAPIDDIYMKGLEDFGITIINGYGITECSPIVAINRVDSVKYGTVGKAIPTVSVDIRNKNEDGEGEVWVKGDIVMMGYYNNEEATNEVIKDGWFNTGDIGKIVDGEFLGITGRKKNLIILANGKNVYPEELEFLVAHIEGVTECLVYEEDDMIAVEIYSDAEDDREKVKENIKKGIQELNNSLASYKQIRKIKFRSVEFEKTTTKKIKRSYKN